MNLLTSGRKVRVAAALLLIGLSVLGSAGPAGAHATLVRVSPAGGSVVAESPTTVSLHFSEPIAVSTAEVEIQDTAGTTYEPIALTGGESASVLDITMAPVQDGVYSFRWRVVSASDAHVTTGLFVLGVGAGADIGAAAFDSPSIPTPADDVVIRWALFAALSLGLGAAVLAGVTLRHPNLLPIRQRHPAVALLVDHRALELARNAASVALAVSLAQFGARAVDIGGRGGLTGSASDLLGTPWGQVWVLRVVTLGALTGVMFREAVSANEPRLRKLSLIPGFLLVAWAVAASGHSAAAGVLSLDVAIAFLHQAATAVWVGVLAALIWGLRPVTDLIAAREVRQGALRAFGPVAMASVLVMAATGVHAAGVQIATPDALIDSTYGQALVVKIAFVAAMLIFGLVNHLRVNYQRARVLPKLPMLRAEVGLGIVVLAIVGFLTASLPANGTEWDDPGTPTTTQFTTIDDMQITLDVTPNRAGENLALVRAGSIMKPEPAAVGRVIVRARHLTEDVGLVEAEMKAAEEFRVFQGQLTLAVGRSWAIDVIVRRAGLQDAVASFEWTVPIPGARSEVLSNDPLSNWTDPVALAIAALALALATVGVGRKAHAQRRVAGVVRYAERARSERTSGDSRR
jgi:copper transport protein